MLPSDAMVLRCYQIKRNDPNFELVRLRLQGELMFLKTIAHLLPDSDPMKAFCLNPTVDNLPTSNQEAK